ncbi:MAG TPA: hypothetical protein VKY27_10245 [Bacteriovoracaceae bacterium]|nr:hypothetical protein [Bacteriovoracaceae bacterium]
MGLLYPFPVSEEETDFVKKDSDSITLKSYGLPYIFWLYAVCIIGVIILMFIGIRGPILKLISLGDETDATLGYALLTLIGISPIAVLSFFFYEKRIIARKNEIKLQHRVFWIPVFTESFKVESMDQFSIEVHMDSPNVARIKSKEGTQGFQNKGYFILWLTTDKKNKILIDRHSRKVDLEKLRKLLEPVISA